MNKIIFIIPALLALYLCVLHVQVTQEEKKPQYIERPLPYFNYPDITAGAPKNSHINKENLPDHPIMINIFASWCPTCKLEHEQLLKIAREKHIPIYGIAFRDQLRPVQFYLIREKNPYRRVMLDTKGTASYIFNITSTPQSFIVDAKGHIRYHHKGPISEEQLHTHILPAIQEASK